jgi:hypothetical protein
LGHGIGEAEPFFVIDELLGTCFKLKGGSSKRTLSHNFELLLFGLLLCNCVLLIIPLLSHVELELFSSADWLNLCLRHMPVGTRGLGKVEMRLVVLGRLLKLNVSHQFPLQGNFLPDLGIFEIGLHQAIWLLAVRLFQTLKA